MRIARVRARRTRVVLGMLVIVCISPLASRVDRASAVTGSTVWDAEHVSDGTTFWEKGLVRGDAARFGLVFHFEKRHSLGWWDAVDRKTVDSRTRVTAWDYDMKSDPFKPWKHGTYRIRTQLFIRYGGEWALLREFKGRVWDVKGRPDRKGTLGSF